MELLNFFDEVQVSEDGKRMVGRRYGRRHPKATTEQSGSKPSKLEAQIITVNAPSDNASSNEVLNAIMAGVTKKNIENYQAQADEIDRELNAIEFDIRYYTNHIKRLRKKLDWWKTAAPYYTISCGVLGLVSGLVFSVQQVLRSIGATTTILSTIGATFLYLIASAIFALIFMYISYHHTVFMTKYHREEIGRTSEILKRLSASKKAYTEKRGQIAELIRQERQLNWQYRGII